MKHSRYCSRLFLLFSLFYSHFTHSAAIIFDLGNVLIETRQLQSLLTIGPLKMVSYACTLQNPFSIHIKLFEFLNSIEPRTKYDPIVTDPHGHLLPPLMCEWLKGTILYEARCNNVIDLKTLIAQNADRITNWAEHNLVLSLAQTLFTPHIFAATRYIVPEGVEFVKACKEAGHQVYILSNWDPLSFTEIQNMHPEFFNLFNGIIISGDVHLLKPDPAIYYYLLHRYDLQAKDCIYVDDLLHNVTVANQLGMYGIHYTKKQGLFFNSPDFDTVREKINAFQTLKDSSMLINNNGY